MSADRNPGIKPRRNRSNYVVKGTTPVRDGIKGNRRLIPLISFEPSDNLVVTPENWQNWKVSFSRPSKKLARKRINTTAREDIANLLTRAKLF